MASAAETLKAYLHCARTPSEEALQRIRTQLKKQYGAEVVITVSVEPELISGYVLLAASTLLIIYAYRGVDYKNGPIMESLGYILIMVLSRIFFDEQITRKKLIGNLLILAGVVVFYLG